MQRSTVGVLLVWLSIAWVVPQPATAQSSRLKEQYPYVRFFDLARFPVPDGSLTGIERSPHASAPSVDMLEIPADVQALDGRPVSVRGYMLPLDLHGSTTDTFLLMAAVDSCHFGMVGVVNEWMLVTMTGRQRAEFHLGRPLTVFGTLSVAPEWHDGLLVGLYRMTADHVHWH